jgi:hypothetical protein
MRFRWHLQVETCGKFVPKIGTIFGILKKGCYKWYKRDYGYTSNEDKPRSRHPETKIQAKVETEVLDNEPPRSRAVRRFIQDLRNPDSQLKNHS